MRLETNISLFLALDFQTSRREQMEYNETDPSLQPLPREQAHPVQAKLVSTPPRWAPQPFSSLSGAERRPVMPCQALPARLSGLRRSPPPGKPDAWAPGKVRIFAAFPWAGARAGERRWAPTSF